MARHQAQALLAVLVQRQRSCGDNAVAVATRYTPPPPQLEGAADARPATVDLVLGHVLEHHVLGDPARNAVRVLTAVAAIVAVPAVHLQEGLLDQNGPQFALLDGVGAQRLLRRRDEDAMIDRHATRDSVEIELDDVLASRVVHWKPVRLGEDDAGNQRLVVAHLVIRAGNDGAHDGAVGDVVLCVTLGKDTHLLDSEGVQRTLNHLGFAEHVFRVLEIAPVLQVLLAKVVVVVVLEGLRLLEIERIALVPGQIPRSVDRRRAVEEVQLALRQTAIDVFLSVLYQRSVSSAGSGSRDYRWC